MPLVIVAVLAVVGLGIWSFSAAATADLVKPTDQAVRAAEQARQVSGAEVRDIELTAAPARIELGDRTVSTWAFNGRVPGPEIRVRAGDVVRARVHNELPEPLTIHWHGIALRNDMDGVPGVTQRPIEPGASFAYEFTAPDPGTYFYHPHTGTQLDRGLYGPLIVDESEPDSIRDITLMLDDWLDGTGWTPDEVLDRLRGGMTMSGMGGMGHGGMHMGGMATDPRAPLGDDTSDVDYPEYLINGRPASDPVTYSVQPGEKLRLRLVNAGADTPFRVALGGGRLTVVASDGFAVEPVTGDSLLIGMGERYDVIVTAPRAGAVALIAQAEGEQGQALAVLRAGPGGAPDVTPAELAGTPLTVTDLRATPEAALSSDTPDRTYPVGLTGGMVGYRWGIDAPEADGATLPVREGERVRLVLENRTMMWHPMHLHGHTFQVVNGNVPGPRKDTVVVPPVGTVTVEFIADNPGQWALHCHNLYHGEAGMMTTLSYVD